MCIFGMILTLVVMRTTHCQPPLFESELSRCSWTSDGLSSCAWTSPEHVIESSENESWSQDIIATPNPVRKVKDYIPVEVSSGIKLKAKALKRANIKSALITKCKCGRECMKNFDFESVVELRKMFWMNSRNARMNMLKSFKDTSKKIGKYTFYVVKFAENELTICSKTFMSVLKINKNTLTNVGNIVEGSITTKTKNPRDWQSSTLVLLTWLEDYFYLTGERMPHKRDVILPYGTTAVELYRKYKEDTTEPVSRSQFYKKWSENFSYVKARKTNSFTKCTICVTIERQMMKTNSIELRAVYRKNKEEHNIRQMLERKYYYSKRTAAENYPSQYLSLIIDGMDQSKTNLPHFTGRRPKNLNPSELLKTHVSGVLNHGNKQFYAYVDVCEYPHDPNLIMNVLVKELVRTAVANSNRLPPTLYLQADNCWRENKNRYVMSFLELLVKEHIFNEIHLSFLPVGHTHEDIDSQFSKISQKLRHRDAETFSDLLDILQNAERIQTLENFKEWLSPHIADIQHITQPLHYKFQMKENQVYIHFKGRHNDQWQTLNGNLIDRTPTGNPHILNPDFTDIDIDRKMKLIYSAKCLFKNQNSINNWKLFYDNINNMQETPISQVQLLPRQHQQQHTFIGIGIEPEVRQMITKENKKPQTQIKKRQREDSNINDGQHNRKKANGQAENDGTRKRGSSKKMYYTSHKMILMALNGEEKRHIWLNILDDLLCCRKWTLFYFLLFTLIAGEILLLLQSLMNKLLELIQIHCGLIHAQVQANLHIFQCRNSNVKVDN